ncbi:hypothetical protein FPV67DRAFT_1674184 [Lyophyllum atratum]|nr:hypothetical protein FPV67DRAFT_1674184 [Lyophyllum atratum]
MALSTPIRRRMPMPVPNTPDMPYFKGHRVYNFLDRLERCGNDAGLTHSALPKFVLRYCHQRVRLVIGNSPVWSQCDWLAARKCLIRYYGSDDNTGPTSELEALRLWAKWHAREGSITSFEEVYAYHQSFMTRLGALVRNGKVTSDDADICFWRGIPLDLRRTIAEQLPESCLIASTPPEINVVLQVLLLAFADDDLDYFDVPPHDCEYEVGQDSYDPISETPTTRIITPDSPDYPLSIALPPIVDNSVEEYTGLQIRLQLWFNRHFILTQADPTPILRFHLSVLSTGVWRLPAPFSDFTINKQYREASKLDRHVF